MNRARIINVQFFPEVGLIGMEDETGQVFAIEAFESGHAGVYDSWAAFLEEWIR